MKSSVKSEVVTHDVQQIDMVGVYRSLLRVIALWEEQGYTDHSFRQAAVQQHDDLPDPPSELSTRQG